MLTPHQVADRRDAITATDMAAICGLHPYRAPIDVWLEKTGRAPPFVDTERTKWGTLLEPVIRDDFAARRGVHVEAPPTMTHPEIAWAKATPDGLQYQPARLSDPTAGLEIKCHTIYLRWMYGAPLTDEVPDRELIQCTWGMTVTGLPRWDLVVFIDGVTSDYVIERDDDLIGNLIELADRFRHDHLLADKPPAPDGTERHTEWLQSRRRHGKELIRIDDDQDATAERLRLRRLRDDIHELEAAETMVVQQIKERIGVNAGVAWEEVVDGARKLQAIRWATPADTQEINWRGVAADLACHAGLVGGAIGGDLALLSKVLGSWHPDATIEGHARGDGKITAGAALAALTAAQVTLQEIAKSIGADGTNAVERNTKSVPNGRRFTVPTSWSKKRTK